LTANERKALEDIVKKRTSEQRMVLRAQIILLAVEGHRNKGIMEILDVSRPVVVKKLSKNSTFFDDLEFSF
jgi:hypothetical protein